MSKPAFSLRRAMTDAAIDTRFSHVTAALENEHALLGLLLNDRDAFPKAVGLQGDDFAEGPDGLHARLFGAIGEDVLADRDPNPTALTSRFAESLAAHSQPGLIFDLCTKAPPSSQVGALVAQIAAAGTQRRLQRILARPGLSPTEVGAVIGYEHQRVASFTPRDRITAKPFVWRDPRSIPPREWVYGRHYIRRFISGTVAPGGLGKSSQALVEAVAMATGRDLLGVKCREPLRVWYWNGEDPQEEIERRLGGILIHYGIAPEDLADRLYINSGRDCEIVVATETRDGALVAAPVIADLERTIRDNRIDVWIFDPFVSVHEVSENDNNRIGRVLKALAGVAETTNTSGELVHHVRKGRDSTTEVKVEDGRGAQAFLDRVRSARALSPMSEAEAETHGIAPHERYSFFRVDLGKSNLTPRGKPSAWRRLVSVGLGNGSDGGPEDLIGVATRWDPVGFAASAGARQKAPSLKPGQRIVLRALTVLIEAGQTEIVPPVSGVPPKTRGAQRIAVRENAIRLGYSEAGDKSESVKRMINRDIAALVAACVVRVEGDLIWPV